MTAPRPSRHDGSRRGGAAQALAEVVRREWPAVVATLVRITGDLGLAEDAAQDAALEALEAWAATEIPRRPGAWIITVARRRAIDRIRREATGRRKAELLARLEAWDQPRVEDPVENLTGLETSLRDDQLRLVFGCCHPALGAEAQIALTLRSVGGLTTDEIAAGFLLPRTTMAQRLVRAKRKIAAANIPFVLPPDAQLLERLAAARSVLYLIFNEGYAASSGDELVRVDLCAEAIRLAELLAQLVPDDAETLGLVALMLATHARAAARIAPDGVPILLPYQDRSKWNTKMLERAEEALDRSLRLRARPGGPFAVQAAIAVLHGQAQESAATDWPQIEVLYRRLREIGDTPVVALNHAVAVSMVQGPAQALSMLDDPLLAERLVDYPYLHAARADLLGQLGRVDDATTAYDAAIALTASEPEAELLRRKRDAL